MRNSLNRLHCLPGRGDRQVALWGFKQSTGRIFYHTLAEVFSLPRSFFLDASVKLAFFSLVFIHVGFLGEKLLHRDAQFTAQHCGVVPNLRQGATGPRELRGEDEQANGHHESPHRHGGWQKYQPHDENHPPDHEEDCLAQKRNERILRQFFQQCLHIPSVGTLAETDNDL